MKKLAKEEVVEIVRKVCAAEFETAEERSKLLRMFLDNVPDPEATRLISRNSGRLTPEEIVEKALSYKPICL